MALKGIVYILSIYLLYLCCYPCAEDNCVDEGDHISMVHNDESNDDCPESEACTPFCFDSCCATHIICDVAFASININDFNSEEPNFHFSESYFPQLSTTIWQPPKIQG